MVDPRDNGCHSPGRQEGNKREDCDVSVLLRKTEVVCGPPPGVMMDGTSHRGDPQLTANVPSIMTLGGVRGGREARSSSD